MNQQGLLSQTTAKPEWSSFKRVKKYWLVVVITTFIMAMIFCLAEFGFLKIGLKSTSLVVGNSQISNVANAAYETDKGETVSVQSNTITISAAR